MYTKKGNLPERNSIRTLATRGGRGTGERFVNRASAQPEVVFRIVHVAPADGSPPAAYRDQTVEVALGPDAAFQGANLGVLTRRLPADPVVTAVAPRRGKPRPPKEPRTPRVVGLLRKAIEWRALLNSGLAANQAEIARREGVSRARVTQVMALLRLAPEAQDHIIAMPATARRATISERALRPSTRIREADAQNEEPDRLGPTVGHARSLH
jgi:hypothetical protein